MRPTLLKERQRYEPVIMLRKSSLGEKIRCYQRAPEVHSNDNVDTAGKTVLERLEGLRSIQDRVPRQVSSLGRWRQVVLTK